MGTPKRLGLIGAGWVSRYHLPGWQQQAGRVQLAAIADPSLPTAEARAAEFGIGAVYASAADMLASEQLDIVDICAPRAVHAELVQLASAHGVDILCQKPLATNFDAASALVEGLTGPGRLMVHENWRFRPWYRTLKGWTEAGVAGEIGQVSLEFLSSGMIAGPDGKRPALVRQPFFRTQERLLVMEVLIHQFDTLRYLLGDMEVVAARLGRSNDDIVAEDSAAITLLRPADGGLVTVLGNLAVHGAPPAPSDRLRLFGNRATLTLEGNKLTASGGEARSQSFDAEAGYQGSYDAAIAHFLDRLDDGAAFETAPADNLKTLKLVEDCYTLSRFDPLAEPR